MNEKMLNSHGGDIYKASKVYGFKKEDILDFSANINPLGVPLDLKDTIVSNIDNLVNYPDTECMELRAEIACSLNISTDDIITGNGASEIIFLLFDILRPEKVIIPAPAFSEYAKAAGQYGAEIKYFELKEQDYYKLNIDELIAQMTDGVNTIFLCNPNNPTSTLVSKADLLELIRYARDKNIIVIIDEAFIELTEGGNSNSMVECIREYDNLFIVRAFTKLFAIPGLRLGYGIGNPALIRKMWEKKIPWSVNSFACVLGEFLCESKDYLTQTAQWISEERKWFYDELKRIEKLKVFQPETNFVLIKLLDNSLTSDMIKDILAARGILIRDASNFVFLNNRFFRVAIKGRSSNIKLLNALKEVLES